MLESFLKTIKGEWGVIRRTPYSSFVVAMVTGAVVAGAVSWQYQAIISHRDAQIALLAAQRDDYREKLKGASPDEAKATIERLQTQMAAIRWPPLTTEQSSTLLKNIKKLPPMAIIVACETVNCQALADGLASVFKSAPGWQVTILHRGGLDIAGVTGLSLRPREPSTDALKEALDSATNLEIVIGDDTRADFGSGPALLVIGNKPF